MTRRLAAALVTAGALVASAGLALWWPPLALMVLGAAMAAAGLLVPVKE